MSDDGHSVLFTKLYEFVCQGKVVAVFFGMNYFALHAVFCHDGVEVALHDADCAGVAPCRLFGVEGDTNKEFITDNIFQSRVCNCGFVTIASYQCSCADG